jgi:iron(III) transport system substrate-binding protein
MIRTTRRKAVAMLAAAPIALANAPWTVAQSVSSPTAAFDLNALVTAANEEGELTVWDSSSSVEDIAELFMQAYPDIKVNATKVSKEEQVTKLSNEAKGGTPSVDALNFADTGALAGVLLPQGLVTSWFPEDMRDIIPADSQDPAVFVWNPNVFVYNPKTYPNGSPVKNVWELTQPEWSKKIIFEDPSQSPQLADFFTELRINDGDELAAAYKDLFGTDISGEGTPGDQLVAGWAANALVTDDSDNILGDVGDGGDSIGFTAASAYYDAQEQGYDIAVCQGLSPWIGYASPKFAVLVNNAAHPNAAKLWIHFLLGDVATQPVLDNGGWATNPNVVVPDGINPIPGMAGDHSDVYKFHLDSIDEHWAERQNTQDLWAENLR